MTDHTWTADVIRVLWDASPYMTMDQPVRRLWALRKNVALQVEQSLGGLSDPSCGPFLHVEAVPIDADHREVEYTDRRERGRQLQIRRPQNIDAAMNRIGGARPRSWPRTPARSPCFFRCRLGRGICVRTVRSGPTIVFQGVGADGRRVAIAATVRIRGYRPRGLSPETIGRVGFRRDTSPT
jgi:hypothetical protein